MWMYSSNVRYVVIRVSCWTGVMVSICTARCCVVVTCVRTVVMCVRAVVM